MPDETLPLPEAGRIVNDQVLASAERTAYGMGRAYSGNVDPTYVWYRMVEDAPEAIRYYRELELKDDTVGEAVDAMKRSVLKRGMKVIPSDESSLGAEIAAFIQSLFDGLPNWRNSLDAMLEAPFYGFCVAEQIFDFSAGQVVLTDLRDCPQDLFTFAVDQMSPQTGPLRLMTDGLGMQTREMPENKFVVISSRMRAGNRKGRALLREVYWPSWFKRNVQRFWLRLAERGPGTAVTQYAASATQQQKNEALAAAEALITQVAMAIPENMGIRDEFLKATRTADPSTYEALFDRLESQIIRRIEGSTLTSKGSDQGAGTQALGNVHADTKDERSVEMALQLEAAINRQIIPQLVMWNYGPDVPGVKLQIDVAEEEDLADNLKIMQGAQAMGMAIPESYARSVFAIPAPQESEAVLQPIAAAPAFPDAASAAQFSHTQRLAQHWRDYVEGTGEMPQYAFSASPRSRQIQHDLAQFDTLYQQLRDASLDATKRRIREVGDSLAGTVLP